MNSEKHAFSNRLANETSPYLLQHANNPVDWYPWGEEALNRAKQEDKPILVSIGYAACHWCHVMEHESFEDTAIAAIMNAHFVCVKIDREERPDIDQIYMEAVQVMTGSGGWPLNVFLTPDAKPFYGGTYFPPDQRYGRNSWKQVLENVAAGFEANRQKIEEQAENLTNHIAGSESNVVNDNLFKDLDPVSPFKKEALDKIFRNMSKRFKSKEGGFGSAPKFPNVMAIRYLLRYYHFTQNQQALNHALLSLDKMIRGGIYDQIGGGFARYSTDNDWLVPHFEKMLYDNALLVCAMAEAYKLTGNEIYEVATSQTLEWIQREMTSEENGFYSSLDADSDGEEGKFYVWQKLEIEELLGANAELFCAYYDVSAKGNWEHRNILNVPVPKEEFLEKKKIRKSELDKVIDNSRAILLAHREKRVRPGLDDKILLSWNALMCSGYALAYEAFQKKEYREIAVANADFMLSNFRAGKKDDSEMHHTYKEGKTQYTAFLDDYAYLITALFDVYEITFNTKYLEAAQVYMGYVQEKFFDAEKHNYYFTSIEQTDVLLRKKEFYDNATPSGNSTMAGNLHKSAIYFGVPEYAEIAVKIMAASLEATTQYPTSFGRWANNLVNHVHPISEIAVVGDNYQKMSIDINSMFLPNKIIMATNSEKHNNYPLLADKYVAGKTLIYICRNYACKFPVDNLGDFTEQIRDF